jgi:hypothetical protein
MMGAWLCGDCMRRKTGLEFFPVGPGDYCAGAPGRYCHYCARSGLDLFKHATSRCEVLGEFIWLCLKCSAFADKGAFPGLRDDHHDEIYATMPELYLQRSDDHIKDGNCDRCAEQGVPRFRYLRIPVDAKLPVYAIEPMADKRCWYVRGLDRFGDWLISSPRQNFPRLYGGVLGRSIIADIPMVVLLGIVLIVLAGITAT